MPAGRKFATRVGMPMPRFTSMPGESSLAIRRAMIVCGSMSISCVGDEEIDDRCRRYDMIGRYHADGNDIVRTGDDGPGGHRDHRIEIASSQCIAQIAQIVGDERLDQGKVGSERDLEQIRLSSDFNSLLAGLDGSTNAGLRQDPTQSVAAGANALDE